MNLEQFEAFKNELSHLLARYNACIYYDRDTSEYVVDSNVENTPHVLTGQNCISYGSYSQEIIK